MATTQKRYFPKTREELIELVKDEKVHLGEIDVSAVEDMQWVFYQSPRQNFEGLETWDVSHVKNMAAIFDGAKHFNHDISSWDVSGVTNMHCMFRDCKNFNQPLESWNVSKVTNVKEMFSSCTNFNQPLREVECL
ncbi:hypothetical protein NHP21005_19390 (plasmid) [Helicobacter sp. NHP21005]|uniref:BspA family leucine-rich repeat surface protein n=1 Tax=Helicobacter felistomachi TaxID=3040201 RepID=UPI00336A496E|nr:hypothetical protein NHP21005_19390 [Helicobacter sp. NHP21005]